jgi:dihydrofolate synthase/folylpolyglutamate synthase
MTYPEALRYLESFINYEEIAVWPYKQSLQLGRIRDFLSTLNNPQNSLKCLHVAGTKGKGSTCAFITYILRQAGYKVGLYTSPHLSDFRERIRILSRCVSGSASRQARQDFAGMISKLELANLVSRLRPAIDKYNKGSKYGPLSFFEVYTSFAFVYFKEKKTDFLVLETGLGGRLDATNVVEPLVCAITPISYEHTQRLGNTLRKIATEKAGIIKSERSIVIVAPQEKQVQGVIRQKCRKLSAQLFEVGKNIIFKETGGRFSIEGIFGSYPNLKINFLGRHQLVNASVAVGAIEALKFYGVTADIDSIRRGLYQAVWPGRLEVIGRNPWVVLDGAQNIASARILKQAIRENFSGAGALKQNKKFKKLILVFGISKDKDIKGTSLELVDLADAVVLTKSNNPRAQAPEDLAEYFRGKPTYITQSVKEARQLAKRLATRGDLILVTGSLFVVGEFRDGKL